MKTLNVLFSSWYDSKGGAWWTAETIEHWIATQARTLPGIIDELVRILSDHVHAAKDLGCDPWACKPAPADVVERWAKAAPHFKAVVQVKDSGRVEYEPPLTAIEFEYEAH